MRLIQYVVSVIVLSVGLASCATIASPEGGPKDTFPPLLDTLQSTANEQVNFVKQPIELAFQEWVILEDVNNQVLTSPPLEFRPTITLKRRSVLFKFDEREQLRPNVTYTINFGNAVKDLTEKNPAVDLRFVFATGPKLDSLSMQGTLVDVLTGNPVEKALFMLYDNLADSVVRKERPLYFGKSDKEGRFVIKNIREGVFKGFALVDINSNYRFDLSNEKIGLPDTLISIELGNRYNVTIPLFVETPRIRTTAVDTSSRGLVKIAFNQIPTQVAVRSPDTLLQWYNAIEKDTLLVWFKSGGSAPGIVLRQDTVDIDTVQTPDEGLRTASFPIAGLLSPRPEQRNFRQHPEQDLRLRLRTPIDSVHHAGIRLLEDTLLREVRPQIYIDSLDPRVVHVRYPWQENVPYRLELAPDALPDMYGQGLDSATVLLFLPDVRKNFGNMILSISGLNPKYPHLVELLLPDGSIYLNRVLEAGKEEAKLELRVLPPQGYSLRLVEDQNQNGIWDTGNYNTLRQPERIFLRKLEPLRPNWDLEAEVKLEKE